MYQPKPVMLKKNLRNKILSHLIFGTAWVSLFLLVVMFWLPENVKEPAVQAMLASWIGAFVAMLALEEEKPDSE
jgi:hypothetical protein